MLWWLLAQVAVPASPAHAPGATTAIAPDPPVSAVALAPGGSMIVRVSADGTVALADGRPGDRSPAAGEVRIDLRSANGVTILMVGNASPHFLLYRARIARTGADRPLPTSVCPVLPGGRVGIENWPSVIDHVILYGFRYEDHPATACR